MSAGLAQDGRGPRTHDELLTRAWRVRGAAQDRNWGRFRAESRLLRSELKAHLLIERQRMSRVPDDQRRELEAGQRDLVGLVESMALAGGRPLAASPASLAFRFLVTLGYQAELERTALALVDLAQR